jgi:hypothetical protein
MFEILIGLAGIVVGCGTSAFQLKGKDLSGLSTWQTLKKIVPTGGGGGGPVPEK